MIPARRAPWVGALVGIYLLATVGLAIAVLFHFSDEAGLVPLLDALSPALLPAGLVLLIAAALMGLVASLIHESYAGGIARLAERVNLLVSRAEAHALPLKGVPEMRALTEAINRLGEAHAAALCDVEAHVLKARQESEGERKRLAALVGELAQGVMVCNGAGRIVLYNERARELFDCMQAEGSAGFVGLGRPLSGVLDQELVNYLGESMSAARARRAAVSNGGSQADGAATIRSEATALTVMTSSSAGRLLRLRVTPVPASDETAAVDGMVLMAEDVTRISELDARRARNMQSIVQGQRSGLASIRLAAEALCTVPDLPAEERERSLHVVRDEADRLSQQLLEMVGNHAQLWSVGWQLDTMQGTDLLVAACRRIEARTGLLCQVEYAASELWLRTDSFSLIQALSFLATRVSEACALRELRLRLSRADDLAQLDLVWSGTALSTESALGWELEPMTLGGESSPLSVREVVQRHDAELVYQRDRASTRSWFRFLLPAADEEPARVRSEASVRVGGRGRPEFFDFDLFARSEAQSALEDTPLDQLALTAFDTETTGLDPAAGDEIIQIGAVRILNARLLRSETYEQLIDPQRPISATALAVHGITPDRLRGQPVIEKALPQFHAFAADTVLLGHNLAFDMRFLQLKEARSGLRFKQPVLDTLLLSAVLHPNHDSHRLEAIAERFGLSVVDRHSALGDALLTAQIFLRMIPQLAMRGIHTLGEAHAASKETWHARIRY